MDEPLQTLKVSRLSPVTNKRNVMVLKCRRTQLIKWINNEGHVQDLLPELTADEREFLISGCTPEDFNKLFPASGF